MNPHVSWMELAWWYVTFLVATTCHEAAHAWAAWRLGDSTAYRGGQVTLDPTPHIRREPFGMVIVPLLSYLVGGWMIGWASTPYNPQWAATHPRKAAWMALAGPFANLLLAVIAIFLMRIGLALGYFSPPFHFTALHMVWSHADGVPAFLAQILSMQCFLNVLLCAFNLLPVPPLDGSNLPLLWLSASGAARYQQFLRSPMIRMFGLLFAWKIFAQVFDHIVAFIAHAMYPTRF